MAFKKRFSKIRHSFFAVILLVQVLMIALATVMSQGTIHVLNQSLNDKHEALVSHLYNEISNASEIPKAPLMTLLQDQDVLRMFAQKDRQGLYQKLAPLWEQFKTLGFSQLQFEVADHQTYSIFLRMQNPTEFGDIVDYRPMLNKVMSTQKPESGLEQGRSGYGLRVMLPAFYQGKMIGTVELGSNFGDMLLQKVEKDFHGNYALFNLKRGIRLVDDHALIAKLGKDSDGDFQNRLPDEEILKSIYKSEPVFSRLQESKTVNYYIPIKDFQGDVVAILKYVYPSQYYSKVNNIILISVIACVATLLISLGVLLTLHRLISRPLKALIEQSQQIQAFHLDEDIEVKSPLTEMTDLIEATSAMKNGLKSFRKYVPAELVRQLIATQQVAVVGGQRKNLTVLFSDIANFTTISEQLSPLELTQQLSEYLSAMTGVILKYQGTVDKYIGDAVMAFWGAPIEIKEHAEKASLAALECQIECAKLNQKWEREGRPPFHTRIGINSGDIIVGNMGSAQRLNYTIIGDDVNLASRIEGFNKIYGTRILLSQNTFELLSDEFATRILDYVVPKGKSKPVAVYELVAKKGEISARDLDFLRTYNLAMKSYRERNWSEAEDLFQELVSQRPQDLASKILLDRLSEFKKDPPPNKWGGELIKKSA